MPVAVLCANAEQALALAEPVAGVAAVAALFWPGPLTLVLPRATGVELHLGEPEHTVGLRVPDHDLVRAVATASRADRGDQRQPSRRTHGAVWRPMPRRP